MRKPIDTSWNWVVSPFPSRALTKNVASSHVSLLFLPLPFFVYTHTITAEIRFRVKSIHFTQITKTAKGTQATTTTTSTGVAPVEMSGQQAMSSQKNDATVDDALQQPPPPIPPKPVRQRRSSSVTAENDNDEQQQLPAMYILASICEDGLGLTSWWMSEETQEDE
jgi:hypothetical protein